MIKVGTSIIDVTPLTPQVVCGHAMRSGKSTGVHDPLELTVLIVDVDGKKFCGINADLIGMGKNFLAEIKEEISEKVGVEKDLIVYSVTHTHSGPNCGDVDAPHMAADPEYLTYLKGRVVEAAVNANKEYKEVAHVLAGKGEAKGYYSNRNGLDKIGDQWVYVLKFTDADYNNLAVLVNMSCHSTINSPLELQLSADMLGNVRRHLVDHYGVIPCMANGNAGNMSNRQLRQGNDFNELERVTSGIAEEIKKITEFKEITLDQPKVKTLEFVVDYHRDVEPMKAALAAMEAKVDTEENFDAKKWMYSEIAGYKRKISKPDVHVDLSSSVIRMGELEMVIVPCEMAAELGMYIKKASNAKFCFVWGYANGQGGYVVEADQFDGGHDGISTELKKGMAEEYMGKVIQTLF